jgi:tRNA nucleotidyltransferase/poly(A) polymerase
MFTFYEVGGKVRDELLGLKSKDIDYTAVPNNPTVDTSVDSWFTRLCGYLKEQGYDVFLETPDCYTIRAKFPLGHKHEGTVADFVLARKEIAYEVGTRKPVVVPGTLEDDLMRRDFTVNAIAKDSSGKLIDPFNGIGDLDDRILRTPISGDITFEDDPLRLLRAIRFAVTKGFMIDRSIEHIIQTFDYKNKFSVVSTERIREELTKAFKANTILTLAYLDMYKNLRNYIFKTGLWLKPTNEQ